MRKERKLTSCDNGKDRSNGIRRGGVIRSRSYRSKGSNMAGGILY